MPTITAAITVAVSMAMPNPVKAEATGALTDGIAFSIGEPHSSQ